MSCFHLAFLWAINWCEPFYSYLTAILICRSSCTTPRPITLLSCSCYVRDGNSDSRYCVCSTRPTIGRWYSCREAIDPRRASWHHMHANTSHLYKHNDPKASGLVDRTPYARFALRYYCFGLHHVTIHFNSHLPLHYSKQGFIGRSCPPRSSARCEYWESWRIELNERRGKSCHAARQRNCRQQLSGDANSHHSGNLTT